MPLRIWKGVHMGTRLALAIAPEFLAALLGVTQEDIDRAFVLVNQYEEHGVTGDGFDAYKVMMEDPVASILADYQRPFEYEGETYGGTLGFGKWGANIAWKVCCARHLRVDPTVGTLNRDEHPDVVDHILDALRYEEHRPLNWVVIADHCTGVQWG